MYFDRSLVIQLGAFALDPAASLTTPRASQSTRPRLDPTPAAKLRIPETFPMHHDNAQESTPCAYVINLSEKVSLFLRD
jgi:hypothetical protein